MYTFPIVSISRAWTRGCPARSASMRRAPSSRISPAVTARPRPSLGSGTWNSSTRNPEICFAAAASASAVLSARTARRVCRAMAAAKTARAATPAARRTIFLRRAGLPWIQARRSATSTAAGLAAGARDLSRSTRAARWESPPLMGLVSAAMTRCRRASKSAAGS